MHTSDSPLAEDPKVTVGGEHYQIRFSLTAWVLLESRGYTRESVTEGLGAKPRATIMEMAAAALGNYDATGQWESAGRSVTWMTDRLTDAEISPIMNAVGVALKKLAADVKAKRPAAPVELQAPKNEAA